MSRRSAAALNSVTETPRRATRERDEWDLKAADTLAAMRKLAGLTLEELGEKTGENFKTIWLRENSEVAMGAMRQYEILRAHLEGKMKCEKKK
jgi:hypothetical protein